MDILIVIMLLGKLYDAKKIMVKLKGQCMYIVQDFDCKMFFLVLFVISIAIFTFFHTV